MKTKICEYCGTEYKDSASVCPLCGKGQEEASADVEKKSSDRVPQWMWIMTCTLMGLAVVLGMVYFIASMKISNQTSVLETEISAPVEQAPKVEAPEVPEEPEVAEPEDLSCTGLELSQTKLVLDEQGGHVFLTAVPAPRECEDEIVFASADEEIAIVDESGMITAVSAGETEILVTCGDITESCVVICDFDVDEEDATEPEEETPEETEEEPEEPEEKPTEEVSPQVKPTLSSVDFTLFRPGEETVLTVRNAPAGATITYTTSDASVATVTDTGTVTAVGDGTAIITVTVNGTQLTCYARCRLGTTTENNDMPAETTPVVTGNCTLSHVDVTLFTYGETFNLVLRDSSGNRVTGATYSSGNTGVCSVDANGLVTAIGRGMTKITVSYGGKTYNCDIHCEYLK